MFETFTNTQYAAFLRELADFYESRPGLPRPTLWGWRAEGDVNLDKKKAKDILRTLGAFEKKYTGDQFDAIVTLPSGGKLVFTTPREAICRKVVVGKKFVPEEYIPGKIEPAHEVEIVEWQCDEPILAETQLDAGDMIADAFNESTTKNQDLLERLATAPESDATGEF